MTKTVGTPIHWPMVDVDPGTQGFEVGGLLLCNNHRPAFKPSALSAKVGRCDICQARCAPLWGTKEGRAAIRASRDLDIDRGGAEKVYTMFWPVLDFMDSVPTRLELRTQLEGLFTQWWIEARGRGPGIHQGQLISKDAFEVLRDMILDHISEEQAP